MHIVAVLFRKSHNVQSPAFRTDHRRAGNSDFWDDGALTASEILTELDSGEHARKLAGPPAPRQRAVERSGRSALRECARNVPA